jgi:hypothetical protein
MIQSKLGLKAVGLCVLVAGLMAVSVSAAQAASWDVEGGATLPAQVQVKAIENLTGTEVKDASLKTTILGAEVKFTCTGAELVGVNLEAAGALTNGGTVKFTGCSTFLNGAAAPKCEAKTAGQSNGTILSLPGKGQLQLIGAAKTTVIVPKTGEEFLTIATGNKCSFGENVPVLGKLALKDANLEVSSLDHLISEEPTNTKITALGNPATLVGSANVSLIGAGDEDKNWRGLAE